ncbi:MAG: hypothetical protein AAFQ82_10120 [Myxococcota bacterium]
MSSAVAIHEAKRRPIRFGRLVSSQPKLIDVEITPAPSRRNTTAHIREENLVKRLLGAAIQQVGVAEQQLDGRKRTRVSVRHTQIEILRDAVLESRQRLPKDSEAREMLNEGLDLAEAATDLSLPYRNQEQALEALMIGASRAHGAL